MTVREPTLKMRLAILETQLEDFHWALDRVVMLMRERDPVATTAIVNQVQVESRLRQAQRTRAANAG